MEDKWRMLFYDETSISGNQNIRLLIVNQKTRATNNIHVVTCVCLVYLLIKILKTINP